MKNKGFTLVELLAVLIILGIVSVIAVPSIGKVLERSRQRAKEGVINEIEQAATKYIAENIKIFSEKRNYCISLETLIDGSYIKGENIIDPIKENNLTGAVIIEPLENDFKLTFVENEFCNGDKPGTM